ncbi:helix-turn-helix domain-containing protein [Cohnella candidum]|uniref:AraC family transcriptional regulator n=1 Tax=Cohnella candidum TaxID=2674991 RepID=A0A3G3K3C0_9BACL|nr:helix-turn-helix domain-containing protein [Cohnella candidum]AYQ74942.1 AraC family transcriptional regulator [Cohnella candidum]
MTFMRRIRQYRVYRRMVLSYLLLTVVTLTLLSFILYSLFSNKAVQEIDQSSRQMLAQVSYTANVVYEQVQTITGQLLSDHEIVSFLGEREDNKIANYTASLFLARIQGVYPFIENLSLYNFTTGGYVDSLGLPLDPGMFRQDESGYFGFFPRKVTRVDNKPLRLLTFKFIPERSFTQVPRSAIVFDLDESYIRNTMRSIGGSSRESGTFVMDGKGKVLSHSNPEFFMEDFSSYPYVRKILSDTAQGQGSFVEKIDHQKQLVTYVKSSNLDWYFVSTRPYAEMISNINQIRYWTILVALLLIVGGTGLSLLISGNIYNPIRALLDKVNAGAEGTKDKALLRYDEYEMLTDAFDHSIQTAKSLELTLNRSSKALKDSYLSHLLQGNSNKIAVSAEMKREWESRLSGPFLTVVLFKVDGYRSFREGNNAFDRGLYRFAISNIAQELLGKLYRVDVANMEEDEIALILQSDEERLQDSVYLTLGEIQDRVREYYQMSLSAGIGVPSASISEIYTSYKSAQEALKMRLFQGYGCIADARRIQEAEDTPSRYPISVERRLIEAVKLGNRDAVLKEIEEFRKILSQSGYMNAMHNMNFMVLGIIREFEYITEWWSVDVERLDKSLERIREIETMDDMQKLLSGLCFDIVDILEENKKNTTVSKNAKIVEDIQQYVKEHYSEHGLSLESAAERFGFSAGYIGKLFKSMAGTTFNDFVTHTRMEQAKLLLVTKNDPIAQIGEMVGMYNVPYFTTVFKKKYGVTPSQYREQAPKDEG